MQPFPLLREERREDPSWASGQSPTSQRRGLNTIRVGTEEECPWQKEQHRQRPTRVSHRVPDSLTDAQAYPAGRQL